MPPPPESPPGGVIHDLGYRGYHGERRRDADIARSLFVTGLKHAFGIGRSGRSKVLPFVLLALYCVTAAVLVGLLALGLVDALPIGYTDYAFQMQTFAAIFAAAQAPVLISRDLRHRSIVLYLARPLSAALFGFVRWLSLTAAITAFLLVPIVILYAGALLARLDLVEQSRAAGVGVLAAVVLAAVLAGVTALISVLSTRRGFAVVASIAVLILGGGIVTMLQSLAAEAQMSLVAQLAGLGSPFTLASGFAHLLDSEVTTIVAPEGPLVGAAYVAAALAVPAACVAIVQWRLAKAAAR